MIRDPIRITREELHRLVWSKTMRRVAEELGTSYLEIVKACKAMDVPRPVSGEWKSLLLGQAVSQVPLPESETGVAVEFFLRPIEKFSEEDLPPLPDFPRDEAAKAKKAKTRAQIADTVMGPVRDMTGALVPRLGRAVHALVCELEHRGYRFEEGENDGAGLGIVREGDRVEVRWSEGKIFLYSDQQIKRSAVDPQALKTTSFR